ncbi:hypothetical protein [Soonwooa sp.]|nr:hypothetical protein [Soonwooa sp.]
MIGIMEAVVEVLTFGHNFIDHFCGTRSTGLVRFANNTEKQQQSR